MNKKEVIQRLRDHLRGLNFKISEPEVYIPTYHYRWCITYIMDFLLVERNVAIKIMKEEVLAGSKLITKPVKEAPKSNYGGLTPKEYAERLGVSINALMYRINTGQLLAFKDESNHWVIPKDEAERFAKSLKK